MYLIYDAIRGPIESTEQPDPSVLKSIGHITVYRKGEFRLFAESGDKPSYPKRVWATPA